MPVSDIPVSSFAAATSPDATVLILGSMPGVRSLQARQYYAHPRNSFWPIMGALFGFDPAIPYARRLDALRRSRIALWDVLASCVRPGSLDSAIESGSRVPNDFDAYFEDHRSVQLVCFNGAEAETSFRRQVEPRLQRTLPRCVRLPSSSPAHAALNFEQKLAAWEALIRPRSAVGQSTAAR
jgi:hypoxanthine-DNA glycosylase